MSLPVRRRRTSTPRRAALRRARRTFQVGREIGCRQPDALLGTVQISDQRLQYVAVLAGVGVRHPAQSLAAVGRRRQPCRGHRLARAPGPGLQAGVPLALEQGQPVGGHRALHFHHHFVPGAAVVRHRPELVGRPGAAHEGQVLVDQQQLAVVAVQDAPAGAPAQRVVLAQLATGRKQAAAPGATQAQAAESVEQAAHRHPAGSRDQQRFEQALGATAALHQVQLQVDLALRVLDGREHAREEIFSIAIQGEAVAAAPGKDRPAHRAAKISTAPTGTERPMPLPPASWRRRSTPGARPKSASSTINGARVTTWKRRSSRRVTSTSAR